MAPLSVVTYHCYGQDNLIALEHVPRELRLVHTLLAAANQRHPQEPPIHKYGTFNGI